MIPNARVTFLLFALLGSAHAPAATRTVNDTGDAGDGTCDATCTLRDAVNAAQADDRILFDLALPSPVVIGLTGPALQIDVPLRITATDGVATTIRRTGGSGRLLDVISGGDARIIGLGFQNGTAPFALGMPGVGGAVHVASGAALELRQCVFRDNSAAGAPPPPGINGPGQAGQGGAIYALGDLIVDGSAFIGNKAYGGSGGFDPTMPFPGGSGGGASGGAIHAEGIADILNSTFSGNAAYGGTGGPGGVGTTPGIPGGNGGNGGPASGGALGFGASASVTVAFSTLIANDVVPGTGGPGGAAGPPMPGFPPPSNGQPGANGIGSGAALSAAAATVLNVSAVAANVGADQCAGGALVTARTTNLVADGSCPGTIVAGLESQFEAIDLMAASPHFVPKFDSAVVDAAPDCLDAVAFEAVDLDQLLTPRPLTVHAPAGRCDIGAIEHNPVLFGDGFEEPPPPP
ncbi:MAG: hypothetical protein IPO95_07365 [Rhodanobacteraceae bacterium]|nr:hypothetical protein [Rhodanobacteraceae bacterium]